MPLIHVLWYLDTLIVKSGMLDGVLVVAETPAMAEKIRMHDVQTLVAYLAVNPGRQKDINVAMLGALQHAIVMRHLLEDQLEKGDTCAAWDVQQNWLSHGIPLWLLDDVRGCQAHEKEPSQKLPSAVDMSEAPARFSAATSPHA